ncbi:hypothetical protein J7J23_02215 [bacterium]|nr:hypothetical protein [bacterium]
MKNILILLLVIALFLPFSALAVCPICTVAVAGGVGLSRWLGIDDVISGIWIGGLVISLALWFLSWLDKKNIKFKFRSLLILALFYSITIFPLYQMKLIGHSCNNLWGQDKLLIGIIFGSLILSMGAWAHNLLKKRNNNRAYFPFQKVIIPILFLVCASIIFYFITKC